MSIRKVSLSRRKLQLELLEEREVPTVQLFEVGGFFGVVGDASPHTIAITDNGTQTVGNVNVTVDGVPHVSTHATAAIWTWLGDGGNTVTYQLTADLMTGSYRSLWLSLGNGANHFVADVSNHTLQSWSFLSVSAIGGAGNDNLGVEAFNTNVSQNSYLGFGLYGGAGDDTLMLGSSGQVNGALAILLAGGAGNDTVAAIVTLNSGSTGAAAAIVDGGPGNDNLTLNVYGSTPWFFALADGGGGTDTATTTNNVWRFRV